MPESPTYRITAVSALTGVPEGTLRAWERRYDFPSPRRTSSGYRVYTQRDVEQIQRMHDLFEAGIAPAEAALRIRESQQSSKAKPDVARDPFGAAALALLAAIERLDEVAIDREVRRLGYLGPIIAVVDEVIGPVLVAVGERWHAGKLSVAHEHLATQKLSAALRDFVRLASTGDRRVIVACVAEEQHELGAMAVAVRLATYGFRPAFLGARTPPDALRAAVAALRPEAVALSATMALERDAVRAYAGACGKVPWVMGGAAVRAVASAVRGAGGYAATDVNDLQPWLRRHLPASSSRSGA